MRQSFLPLVLLVFAALCPVAGGIRGQARAQAAGDAALTGFFLQLTIFLVKTHGKPGQP
jgi:hypothetical protein